MVVEKMRDYKGQPKSPAPVAGVDNTCASGAFPKRLSRFESKAQTRLRLITVAREHFLKKGLNGASAEQIAEDAGFSRGALYSNFDGKEDLFIAVIEEDAEAQEERFRALAARPLNTHAKIQQFRNAFVELVAAPDWITLYADFQMGALRNEAIRKKYIELNDRRVASTTKKLEDLAAAGGLTFSSDPASTATALLSFAQGMAIQQKILGSELRPAQARKQISVVFDRFMS